MHHRAQLACAFSCKQVTVNVELHVGLEISTLMKNTWRRALTETQTHGHKKRHGASSALQPLKTTPTNMLPNVTYVHITPGIMRIDHEWQTRLEREKEILRDCIRHRKIMCASEALCRN